MRLYVRVPLDADEAWGLVRLAPEEERTFWRILKVARLFQPHVGHLCGPPPRLKPWSQRELARLTRIPRATLQRHIPELIHHGQLIRTLSGALIVRPILDLPLPRTPPQVAGAPAGDGQIPLPFTATTPDDRYWSPASGSTNDEQGRPSVHNGGRNHGPPTANGPPVGHLPACEWAPTPKQEQNRSTYGRPEIEDLGITLAPDGVSLLGDLIAGVPGDIEDSTVRYLLGKLARDSAAWARVLKDGRDRGTLRRLYSEAPSALLAALQQAADDPGQIRNPGAWLTRTVPALALEATA